MLLIRTLVRIKIEKKDEFKEQMNFWSHYSVIYSFFVVFRGGKSSLRFSIENVTSTNPSCVGILTSSSATQNEWTFRSGVLNPWSVERKTLNQSSVIGSVSTWDSFYEMIQMVNVYCSFEVSKSVTQTLMSWETLFKINKVEWNENSRKFWEISRSQTNEWSHANYQRKLLNNKMKKRKKRRIDLNLVSGNLNGDWPEEI